jgi:hypothetical protein
VKIHSEVVISPGKNQWATLLLFSIVEATTENRDYHVLWILRLECA